MALALTAAGLLCVALAIAGAFLPEAPIWGSHHLSFYPLWVRLAAAALLLVAWVPAVARRVEAGLYLVVDSLQGLTPSRLILLAGLAGVLCSLAFFSARSATDLMGDGQLTVTSFRKARAGDPNVVMVDAVTLVREERVALGATLVYYAAEKIGAALELEPVLAMRASNCLLGGVYVALLLLVVARARLSSLARVWLLILGLFSASLQLYFGYIENYTLLHLILVAYAVSGAAVLSGRGSPVPTVLLFVAAVVTHLQGLLALPSLVMLVVASRSARWARAWWLRPSLVLAAGAIAFVVARAAGAGSYILPLLPSADSPAAVLAPHHLLHSLQELLLLLPVLPLLLVMAWNGRNAEPGDLALHGRFFALLMGAHLLFLIFADPILGMVRDWDRYSMLAVGMVPCVALLVHRGFGGRDSLSRVTAPAMILVVVMGTAWFGINASRARTIARMEAAAQFEPRGRTHLLEGIATEHHEVGDVHAALAVLHRAYETGRNPRLGVKAAVFYEEIGQHTEAILFLQQIMGRQPQHHGVRSKLVKMLADQQRWAEIVSVAQEGMRRHPHESLYPFFLGEALLQQGQLEPGIAALRRCLALMPPPVVQEQIARRFLQLGVGQP